MRRFGSLIWRNQHKKGKWCRREFSTQKQSWKRNGFASQIACFAGGVASCYAFLQVRKENDEFDVGMMEVRKENDEFDVGIMEGRESEFKSTKIEQKAMTPDDVDVVIFHGYVLVCVVVFTQQQQQQQQQILSRRICRRIRSISSNRRSSSIFRYFTRKAQEVATWY